MKIGRITDVRKLHWGLLALLILVVAVVLSLATKHYHTKTEPSGSALYAARLTDLQQNQAKKSIKNKNYSQAEQNYITAAAAASSQGENDKAIAILQDGINNIPDKYVSWLLYDALSGEAKESGNNQLEIESIKKAQTKLVGAKPAPSPELSKLYVKRLKELGAS